jgi:hypothetical protein
MQAVTRTGKYDEGLSLLSLPKLEVDDLTSSHFKYVLTIVIVIADLRSIGWRSSESCVSTG